MDNKKEIIKKLLDNSLTPEEQSLLLEHQAVSSRMHIQWDESGTMNNTISDSKVEARIWKKIMKQTWTNEKMHLRISFYKIYSIAVSILLLFGVGITAYMLSDKPVPCMYVVNTGLRNIRSVTLPDGTVVNMGPGSTLTYPEEFSGDQRLVKLDGQAFFNVAHNKEKPFIVSSEKMNVTAIGTSFEVFDYTGKKHAEAILTEGKVEVDVLSTHARQANTLYLIPNQKLSISQEKTQVMVESVDAERYSAWHNCNGLSFENESIRNIIPRLEQWYGRCITCKDMNLNEYLFTFKVRDESIEDILYLMSQSADFKYTKGDNGNIQLLK